MFFLLLIHTFSTFFMTGLIWTIQLIHYPSFKFYHPENFQEFHSFHSRRITFIVLPVMLAELISGFFLLELSQIKFNLFNASYLGLIIIWLSTFFIQVPLHQKLSHEFDKNVIVKLVRSNWIRTFLWTLRSVIIFLYWKKYV